MAGDGKEKKSKTKAKTDHDLTTDGGATRSTLSRLTSSVSSTVSNNKKTLTIAGAAAAGVATAAGVAVALKRRKASLKTAAPESSEVSPDLTAGQTVPLREV